MNLRQSVAVLSLRFLAWFARKTGSQDQIDRAFRDAVREVGRENGLGAGDLEDFEDESREKYGRILPEIAKP